MRPEFVALLATADYDAAAFAVLGYIEATCKSPLLKPKQKVQQVLAVIEAYDTERARLASLVEDGHRKEGRE